MRNSLCSSTVLLLASTCILFGNKNEALFKKNTACFQARNLAVAACLPTRSALAESPDDSGKQSQEQLRSQLSTLKGICRQYEATVKENDLGVKAFEWGRTVTVGTISMAGNATARGGIGIAVKAVAYGMNKGLGLVEDEMKRQLNENLRRNLATNLEKYRKSVSEQEWADFTSPGRTPEQIRVAIEARTGPLLGNALDNVKQEDQVIVHKVVERELSSIMAQGFESVAQVNRLQDAEIAENRSNIVALSQAFYKYAQKNQDTLKEIVTTQVEIKSDLSDLNDRLGKTEAGVNFMANYMFGKMSASEQLSALRGGLLSDMPADEKKDLEQKIAVAAKQEKLEETLNEYINGADQLITIAENLGLSPSLTAGLRTVSSVASTGVKAFTAFASGDLLSGISAVTSLFGLGGPDIAEQRHQEIMNALGQIYQGITVMDHKLDEIQKSQRVIIENQRVTLQAIVDLGNEVQHAYQALDEHLTKIEGAIYVNRDLIEQNVRNEYTSCVDLIAPLPSRNKIIDTESGMFPSYERLRQLFRDKSIQMNHCADRLLQIRAEDDSFLPVFWAKSNDTIGAPVAAFIDKVYTPASLMYLRAGDTTVDGMSRKLSALFVPVQTCDSLAVKVKANIDLFQPRLHRNKADLHLLMGDMLSPQRILRHGNLLLDAHVLYLVTGPDNTLVKEEQLLEGRDLRMTAYEPLVETLSMTDVAIAQQSLLGGDALLPVLYDTMVAGLKAADGTRERGEYNKVVELLRNSAILAENFSVYVAHREVLTRSNRLSYHLTFNSAGDLELPLVFSSPWEIRYSLTEEKDGDLIQIPKGWSLVFGTLRIPLPDAEKMAEGRLRLTPEVEPLLTLRERLLQEIAGYNVADRLSADKNEAWNTFLLDSRPMGRK